MVQKTATVSEFEVGQRRPYVLDSKWSGHPDLNWRPPAPKAAIAILDKTPFIKYLPLKGLYQIRLKLVGIKGFYRILSATNPLHL